MASETTPSKVFEESLREIDSPFTMSSRIDQTDDAKDQKKVLPTKALKGTIPIHSQKLPSALLNMKAQSTPSQHTSATFGCWGEESGSSFLWASDHYDEGCEPTETETDFEETDMGESLRSLVSLAMAEVRERASHSSTDSSSSPHATSTQPKKITAATSKKDLQWNELVRLLEETNLTADGQDSSERKEINSAIAESVASILGKEEKRKGSRSSMLGPLVEVSGHSTTFSDISLDPCKKSENGMEQDSDDEEDDTDSEGDASASLNHSNFKEPAREQEDQPCDNLKKSFTADDLAITRSTSDVSSIEIDAGSSSEGKSTDEEEESSKEEEVEAVVSLSLSQAFGRIEDESSEDEMDSSFSLVFDAVSVSSTVTFMDDDEFAWEDDLVDVSMEEKLYQSFNTENAQYPTKTDSMKVSKAAPPGPMCPIIGMKGGVHVTALEGEGESLETFSSIPPRPRTGHASFPDSVSSNCLDEIDSLDYHRKHARARNKIILPGDEMDSLDYHRLHIKSRYRSKNDNPARDDIGSEGCSSTKKRRRKPNKKTVQC